MALPIIIETPDRRPRTRATALASYTPLPAAVGSIQPADANRWMNGVTFVPRACGTGEDIFAGPFDPCIAPATNTSQDPIDGFEDAVTFLPFLAEVGYKCSALSVDFDTLSDYVKNIVDVGTSRALGLQAMEGAYVTTNESLRTAASDAAITGAPLNVGNAMSGLEDWLATTLLGAEGMIHLTPGLFAQVAGDLITDGNRYRTHTGHIVVADAGYRGPAPDGAVTAGVSYAYASGPVWYEAETINIRGADWQQFNYVHDDVIIRWDVVGLVAFEPCTVAAVQVDYSPA